MAKSTRTGIFKDDIKHGLTVFDEHVRVKMAAAAEFTATRAQAYARTEAPWTDRTSNARNGLYAKAFHDEKGSAVVVYHSVPYGIFLEVRWAGRYAIILPTVQKFSVEMMNLAKSIMGQ